MLIPLPLLLSLTALLGLTQPPPAAPPAIKPPAPTSHHLTWTIDGIQREAIIFTPPTAATAATPVIFAFHGHGGTAKYSAAKFNYQKHWPDAISVYMQGLPTPGALTDPEGKRNGWQKSVGDQGDRDLKFFDAVLASLHKDYKPDDSRVYATGHSNGGGFTYLLWAARADIFAAVAPAAAGVRSAASLKPKPAMVIGGEQDELVPFAFQNRTMEAVRKLNGCDAEPTDWAKNCLLYNSKSGTPFVSMIYPGGHTFPDEAPALIVRFFKDNPMKPATAKAPAASPTIPVPPIP